MALSSRINLNSPVTSIQWDSGIGKVKVVTKGQTYQSDMVIVTASLGHLKANVNSLFVPALPQRKLSAISVIVNYSYENKNYFLLSNFDFCN